VIFEAKAEIGGQSFTLGLKPTLLRFAARRGKRSLTTDHCPLTSAFAQLRAILTGEAS